MPPRELDGGGNAETRVANSVHKVARAQATASMTFRGCLFEAHGRVLKGYGERTPLPLSELP